MLTAAHCAFDGEGKRLMEAEITFAAAPNLGAARRDRSYVAGTIVPNPAYTGKIGAGEEAAILVLEQAVNITPMKLAKAPASGATVTAVGFGVSEQKAAGGAGAGTKRIVAMPVLAVSAAEITAGKDGKGTCHGDSGGPLLSGEKVVGIVSYGDTSDCRRSNHFTRVDQVIDFIQDVIDAADDGEEPAPVGEEAPIPGAARACGISISCTNGVCTCGSGANGGKRCDGQSGRPGSCSTVCSACE